MGCQRHRSFPVHFTIHNCLARLSTSFFTRCALIFYTRLAGGFRRGSFLALAGAGLSLAAQAQVTVVSRQPVRHAAAATRNGAVAVGFSQAIASGTANNIRLYGNMLRGKRPGSVAGGGTTTLTFAPGQAFAPGEVLTVSLPATITSIAGTALTRQVYQFTAATGGAGRGFFGDTTLVGNTGNRDQVLGDLDNDGDLDLVTTGALYGCRIFLNNGAGRYSFKNGVIAGQTPSGVALADVDQDGDLDLLVGDADNATVAVCINDGTGDFIGSVTGAQNAPVGLRPVSVAAGDVDGDGDLDFVTANAGGNSATVRFNNGILPLLYTAATTVAMGTGPTAVALADIDNDGDLDLLTTNEGTASSPAGVVNVSRNSGMGSFGAYTSVAVGLQPTELVLADADGDGDLDLLTANTGAASLSLRLNNGSGSFSGTTTLALPAGSTPSGLRAGDVDADGDLDVLVAQGTGGRVITFLNTAGTFAAQARPLRLNRGSAATPVQSIGVTLGDVDGDLDLDLITSDEHGHVLLSLNAGMPPPLPVPVITSLSPSVGPVGSTVTIGGTALTDVAGVFFNGTPAPGFVLNGVGTGINVAVPAGTSSGVVTVVTEDAGTATSPVPFTVVVPVPVLVTGVSPARNTANVPRGSNITATFASPITTATASNLRVFGNLRRGRRPGVLTGGGTATLGFDPTQDYAPGEQISVTLPGSMRAADGNPVSKQVVQFTAATGGTGQLNFATPTALPMTQPGEPVLADIDNDGDLDLLIPSSYTSNPSVRLNDGTGGYSTAPDLAIGLTGVSSLVVGDVDGDGDLDVLAVAPAANLVATMLNNGSGTFISAANTTVNQVVRQVVLGDVDADGDLDMVMATSAQILVRLNNGAGVFSGSYGFSLLSGIQYLDPNNLALGDVDGDGDLDFVVSGANNYYSLYLAKVGLNNGAGQFSNGAEVTLTTNPTRVSLGDLDGDGDLDLAVQMATAYNSRVSVRFNNGTGAFSGGSDLPMTGTGLVLGDADGDGDLDLLQHNGVGLNNGAGSFAVILPIVSNAYYPAGIAVGDLDGDLDLDLITSEFSTVTLRLNRPTPGPTIAIFTPGSGPVGTMVLLTGTNLVGTRTVTLNGMPVLSFAVNSPTELVLTVPPGATTGPIAVTTSAGTATSVTPFVVTLPIAVLRLSPARHAPGAPRGAAVVVTFAQPISSASAGAMRVFGSRLRGRRPGTVTGGGTSTLTFKPTQAFAPGEAVSVSLPATLAGTTSGNVLRHVYQFTAAAGGTGTGLFTTTTNVSIYTQSIGMAVGDIDNDGDQDLLTTDGSIRLNNGTGTFSAPAGVVLGGNPFGLALADLNSDGNLDLLSTFGSVRINTGTGTFTDLPNFANPGYDARDMAVGDLDGDGDIDVVIPRYGTDSLYISYNDGTGRFPARQQLAVGGRPVGVAMGDVDNDGDLDLIAASEGYGNPASTLSICFNNGTGLFTRIIQIPAGSYVARVAMGDLDNDGDLDLVTSSGFVRFNDGAGNFTGTQTTVPGRALALGDLDADGDLDLVVVNGTTTAVRLNNGQGQFSTTNGIAFADTWAGLALVDLDGDGDLDVAATHNSNGYIQLSLNERVAPPVITSFTPASGLPGAPVVITGVDFIGATTVAFNGTTAPGFVVNSASQITVTVPAGATTGPISISNPRGTGTSAASFTVLLPVPVTSLSPVRNATAPRTAPVVVTFGQSVPVNTSATLAVFSAKRGGQLAGTRTGAGSSTFTFTPAQAFQPGEQIGVSLPAYTSANQRRVVKQVYQFQAAVGGTGRGYLAAPAITTLGTSLLGTILGDVDGDGSQDMLVRHEFSVDVQLNNGAAGFRNGGSVAVALNTSGDLANMALGDVDGDGDLDLATISGSTNTVSIRLNNGTGTFSGTLDVPVADRPQSIALADMDGDGDLDFVTANQGLAICTTSVRYNDGTGSFSGTASAYFSNGTNISFSNMEIGDVDGDGDLDAVLVNDTGYVLLNDGNGSLSPLAATFPFTTNTSNIALRDLDGDGDLDLLVLGFSSTSGQASPMSVCLNNGAGIFTATDVAVANNANVFTVGDIDADGDQDFIVLGSQSDPAELWLNNGQATFTRLMTLNLGVQAQSPVLGDLDNDGDLDLVSGNYYTTTYSVRLNSPTPPPIVARFSPATGPEGTTVVITGSGFLGTTAISFNGTNAPGFVIDSPTQLTVDVPVGATTGAVSVTTPVAGVTSATPFTVLALVRATSLAPGRNAIAAARNAPITLAFAAPVTAATAGNLRIFGNQLRGRRPGGLTGGGTATLSFDPAQDFAPGEQISVSLPATMLTTSGGLVRRQVYQFTAATGGPGRGAFRAGTDVPVGHFAFALVVGDLDNDGDLDVLTSTETGITPTIGVLLNNGQAQFSAGTSINPNGYLSIYQLALGDVDSDGDLDVVASMGNYGLSICLNNGNATFAPAINVYGGCNRFALGDMDADGDLDLVATTYQSSTGSVSIMLNDGTGNFAAPPLTAVSAPTVGNVALGDVDGDGDLDVMTGNDSNGMRLYLNNGVGALGAGTALATPGAAHDVALGDLDGDGDLDLAFSYSDATYNGWAGTFVNNGSGDFTATSQRVATGLYGGELLLGDVDHDADLDVIAANNSSISIRINDGLGHFAGTPNVPVHSNPSALALGDLDGDGDLDFAVTQATNGATFVDVRLNAGQALATTAGLPAAAGLTLYPNPAHGHFTVIVPLELRKLAGQAPLRLYNALGQLVLEQPCRLAATGELTVDVANMPAGIYTLRLLLADGVKSCNVAIY